MKRVQVGDVVQRRTSVASFTPPEYVSADACGVLMSGKVVYVHPKGRFHVVEFTFIRKTKLMFSSVMECGVRTYREAFAGVEF